MMPIIKIRSLSSGNNNIKISPINTGKTLTKNTIVKRPKISRMGTQNGEVKSSTIKIIMTCTPA
jgi:hypothetical protein